MYKTQLIVTSELSPQENAKKEERELFKPQLDALNKRIEFLEAQLALQNK